MPLRSALGAITLAAALLLGTSACTARSENTTVAGQAPYEVTDRVLDLRDESRSTDPTPATAGRDATRGRALPTHLYYPASGKGPFPVVVFSHGFRSTPEAYQDLLRSWAAAGFVVAAPTFPLTSRDSPLVEADIRNQPADVSFVLTQVLALGTTTGDLAGRIDSAHIAVAGHSDGAMTTLGVLGTCCRDSRVTAALILSGTLDAFGPTIARPGVPTLFLHGTADDALPLADGHAAYAAAPAPKAFIELPGATHSSPYDNPSSPFAEIVRTVTTDFLRWTLHNDAPALTALRTDARQPELTDLTDDQLTP